MTDAKKVLLTGAAGRIATFLRNGLGDKYALTGTDRIPVSDAEFESLTANLTDFEAILSAFQGVDTVVHLAAEPRHTPDIWWDLLLPDNITATANVFEAARQGWSVARRLLQFDARQRLLRTRRALAFHRGGRVRRPRSEQNPPRDP